MPCVKKGNHYSDWAAILGNIPQGSALRPLLFSLTNVAQGCLLQFADDTCLICSGDSASAVVRMLQKDLRLLSRLVK